MKNPTEKEQLKKQSKTAKPMFDHDEPVIDLRRKNKNTQQIHIHTNDLLSTKAGLPKHGTRWARA